MGLPNWIQFSAPSSLCVPGKQDTQLEVSACRPHDHSFLQTSGTPVYHRSLQPFQSLRKCLHLSERNLQGSSGFGTFYLERKLGQRTSWEDALWLALLSEPASSRTLKEYISVVLRPLVCGTLLQQPKETNTGNTQKPACRRQQKWQIPSPRVTTASTTPRGDLVAKSY